MKKETVWPWLVLLMLNCWETAAFAEKEIKMSHSKAVRVAPMDLSFSQAVVCGPRTKLDFKERLFINPRERHMDARAFYSLL